jgi:putative ABC transport system permease protein
MNLAIKDIRAGLFRFTLTCVGIGLMLMTSLAMTGLYQGIVADALSIIDHAHADLWVIEAGTEGPFAESSLIDRSVLSRSLALQDVATARQFTLQSERFSVRGKTLRASLVGLDYPTDTGRTIPLSAGRHLRAGRNEAIADQSTGLHTGDTLRLGTTDLTVVGVAKNYQDYNGNPMVAVSVNDALDIQAHRPEESVYISRDTGRVPVPSKTANIAAVLLTLEPGANLQQVQQQVNRWGDVIALTSEQEREVFLYGRLERLRGQIVLFTVILLVVTAVVIAVTLYTMTLEKLHEIALLKLIGARNRVIISMILQQSIALGALGYTMATVLIPVVSPFFPRRLVLTLNDYLLFAVIVLLLCIVGALLGIRRAMQVEAREVLS